MLDRCIGLITALVRSLRLVRLVRACEVQRVLQHGSLSNPPYETVFLNFITMSQEICNFKSSPFLLKVLCFLGAKWSSGK